MLRSFLGLAGYYRRFIPQFATVAAPHTELTKKGADFTWSDHHQDAFQALKTLLCSAPVLAYPALISLLFCKLMRPMLALVQC